MKKVTLFSIAVLVALVSGACQPAPEPAPPPEPTATPKPPATPEPTFTPTIEPTATPVGQIFRDDFETELQPGWVWVNEEPENWDISDKGVLRITADDVCLIGSHFQNNLLFYDAPQGISYQVEAKINVNTTSNFQQASVYLFEDSDNYYSANRGYCDICPPKGDGIFSDYMYHNEMSFSFKGRKIDTGDVYLKIVVDREGKWLINYYATEPGKWIQLRKVPLLINIQQVGLGASNCDNGTYDDTLIAMFDYFVITELE